MLTMCLLSKARKITSLIRLEISFQIKEGW